jgi:ABC-type multidrug transport system permease subunit
MMMLSGSMMDIEILPGVFKNVSHILPLTYLNDLLRASMTGAPPLYSPALDFAVLGGWLVVLLLLAVRLWKWE